MTLDTALDWNVGQYLDHDLFLNMRLTNILNSGTELLEEVRTGDDFRLSLEMVPTRSFGLLCDSKVESDRCKVIDNGTVEAMYYFAETVLG